jgi:hypothetical protein
LRDSQGGIEAVVLLTSIKEMMAARTFVLGVPRAQCGVLQMPTCFTNQVELAIVAVNGSDSHTTLRRAHNNRLD